MTYEYKGYIGVANYNAKRDDWTGEVTNTTDLVLFYSNSILELKLEFMKAVNRYIKSFQPDFYQPAIIGNDFFYNDLNK